MTGKKSKESCPATSWSVHARSSLCRTVTSPSPDVVVGNTSVPFSSERASPAKTHLLSEPRTATGPAAHVGANSWIREGPGIALPDVPEKLRTQPGDAACLPAGPVPFETARSSACQLLLWLCGLREIFLLQETLGNRDVQKGNQRKADSCLEPTFFGSIRASLLCAGSRTRGSNLAGDLFRLARAWGCLSDAESAAQEMIFLGFSFDYLEESEGQGDSH